MATTQQEQRVIDAAATLVQTFSNDDASFTDEEKAVRQLELAVDNVDQASNDLTENERDVLRAANDFTILYGDLRPAADKAAEDAFNDLQAALDVYAKGR